MARVFSMIQPSGKLGLGHYLGAIQHWKRMQAQAVKVQTMTKAYNAAMSVAPLVSVASAEVMKAVVDRVYPQDQTQVNDATELLDEGIDMDIDPSTV